MTTSNDGPARTKIRQHNTISVAI
jgi:hypothetical protein